MSEEVEEIFKSLGPLGKYQKLVFAAACCFAFAGSPTAVQDSFMTYKRDYRCFVPSCDNATSDYSEPFVNFSIPYDFEENSFESCSLYSSNNETQCTNDNFDSTTTVNCSKWVYDQDLFKSTVISDFDLVCGKSWLVPVGGSCYMTGTLLGAFIFGAFSDHFGRKSALITAIIFFSCLGLGSAWVNSYIGYLIMRFLTGIGGVTLFATSFVLAVEFIGSDYRTFCGMMVQIPFALGETYTGLMAYFIRDWRWLQTSIIAPSILLIPLYWIMPESVRWLISKGRMKDATKIIEQAARINKLPVPKMTLKTVNNEKSKSEMLEVDDDSDPKLKKKISILDIMRYPKTRKRSFILFYCWGVSSLTYYGLSLNTGNLSGNIFVNFTLTMLIEIPAYIFAYLTLDRIGRKGTMMLVFFLGGISCFTSGLLPSDWSTTIVTLSLIGKFGTSAAFGAIFVYTAEIYPTEIRSFGVGLCGVWSRFGAIIAPIITQLANIYNPLPLLIFGVLSTLAGCLFLFLPETFGTILPQTIEQSENIGNDSIWFFICCPKQRLIEDVEDSTES